jgi:hypothetical protein
MTEPLAQPGILWPFQNICKLWLFRLREIYNLQNRNFNALIYGPPAELHTPIKYREHDETPREVWVMLIAIHWRAPNFSAADSRRSKRDLVSLNSKKSYAAPAPCWGRAIRTAARAFRSE